MRNTFAFAALVLFATLCIARPCPAANEPLAIVQHLSIPETDDGLPGAGPIRRYDWFRNLWKQRRGMWVESANNDVGSVVFYGDSITQGWGDRLQKFFPGLKTANRGISGDTTRGMLLRVHDDALRLSPKAMVLLMGTNDLEEGASPEVIVANVQLILQAIEASNRKMPVVLSLVFPSSETKKRPAAQIKAINAGLAKMAKDFPQVTVLDTWTLFANETGDAKAAEFPDLLHPNDAGYEKWAKALRPLFATAGLVETEPDSFQPEEGFVSLFNGKDLTGWGWRGKKTPEGETAAGNPLGIVSFDGKTASDDGRYQAINGRIVVTTPIEGRRVQQMWTTADFPKDFELRLQFRATPNADSGVFIRKPQLQCRDYPLAGPYKDLKNYQPQEWNDLVVVVQDGKAHCTCNGEVLEAALAVPETGPIGLEGDRGQMEYRRLRLKSLN
ncbi:MAG: G-D-S-L family lipolytic protein [Planctomyces sp.]|nr:G-D-S-L family lipolytic protein [Planctomyces sp.]